uniref:hypothetical protein n=1 Tax=uncultured Bilophila sp. TaxID=529385 RepID=UPI0025CEF6DF|nr:hypothetical protein [uncultured Bilophila sp.]
MRFAATFDASGVRKGAAEAVSGLKSVSTEAERTSTSLRNAAKDAGHYYDTLGRLHRADGKFASSAESAAVKAGTLTASVRKATDQTRALGSSSEKAGKQIQGFGSRSDSASKSLAHASSVADALNQRFASLTQRVLSVYAAYKLLDGVVAATNVGIQANTAWESQKLSIASIVSSTNQLADAQGRVLEGSEKFVASQQVAEKLMQRLQQLGLETTATTQELVNGFQAIIAPALKAGYALEEIPELATRAAQAMGAFQIPIQQMRTEVESLLSGNINRAQDLLAGYLNVTGKMIKDWKAQGVLVEEINKRLESFRYSSDAIANTWAGLTSNIQEYFALISRGSTSGLFDSMKSSVRELQSLMISMNKDTGLAEVSSKVNNIAEAWRRMNDFIGNKILVSTGRFTDWIEELNNPENLAVFETTLSNIWTGIENGASLIGKVSSAFGELSSKAISGWNSMPEIIRDVGIAGAMLYGKRGLLIFGTAMAAFDRLNNIAKGTRYFVQSGEMSFSELFSMPWDELGKKVGQVDKNISGFRGTYNATIHDVKSGDTSIKTSSLFGAGAGDKSKSELNKISNALKGVGTDLARVQMTDAGFRQFQIDQKVADLEKTLGATNPRVQELRAELEKKLQDDFLEEVIGYADPAEKQMIDLQKAYQKFNDTLKASAKLDAEEKFDLQAKVAKRYAHAIDEVNTEQKQLLEFQKETSRIEAENSNDQATLWQMKVDRYEKELWYVEDIAERRSLIEGRINAELAAENKRYTADFGKMWEETYNRVDQAGADMLENFLSGTKNTFDSLKKMFIRTLAEMANAAWLRPITVQVMGALVGVFDVGGTALAYDSATGKMVNTSGGGLGGLSNLSGFSNLMPSSWFSDIGDTINNTMAGWFPGMFSSATAASSFAGQAAVSSALAEFGAGTSMATETAFNALADGIVAQNAAQSTFLSSITPYFMAGGLGSLGYSMLGGALGLPQNKYSGITSGLGAGLGAAIGSVVPGIGTFLGGAVGSLFGGAVGSLFGGKKPKRPATKEKLALNLGGYADGDMSYTLPGDWSGDATAQKVTDYYAVLAHSWNGMGQDVEDRFVSTITGAAQSAVEQAQSLQKLLPESYSEAFQKELQARPIELFYRYRDKDIDDDTLTEIAAEIQEETNRVMLSAFQALDFSEYAGKIDVDQSSLDGMTLFGNAVAVVDETLSAIKELQEPTSEFENAAKQAVAQMKAWEETMKSTGVTAEYAVQLIEDYRGAYIDNFIDTLDESLHPLSAYAQAVKDANDAVDQRKQALEIMGATEEQLARVESMRAEVVKQATEEMLRSFDQSVAQRWAAVNGNSDDVSRAISQENELREAIRQFGEGSAQVSELLHVQAVEDVYAARHNVDGLQNQLNELKAQAIQAETSTINEQLSAAETLKDAWENLSTSLLDSRTKLWTSNTNALGLFARRDAAQSEFDRLYSLTMSGDKEAAAELASSCDILLSLLKETSANGEDYAAGFWDVEQKLKDAEAVAGEQLSEAQKTYGALEAQLKTQQSMLDALELNNGSLDAINAQIAAVEKQLAKAIGTLDAAQSDPNYSGYVSWEDKILAEKTASLNRGEFLRPGDSTNWTPERVRQEMIDAYGSVLNWYKQVGKPVEGFATGGLTPRNEFFKVGEHGEEYMLSPCQYVVLNSNLTRKLDNMQAISGQIRQPTIDYRIMQMPATDGDIRALLVRLVDEVRNLRSENQQLRISTQRIIKATETIADYTEQSYMETAQ